MSALLKFEVAVSWLECPSCHIAFGVTSATEKRLRDTHETFYCPSGHNIIFPGDTEAERVRKQMQATIDAASRKIEWLSAEAETAKSAAASAKKQATAAKTKLTKMKRRVEAGVCPHCNRTFKQLAAHMLTQHKEEIHADEKASA